MKYSFFLVLLFAVSAPFLISCESESQAAAHTNESPSHNVTNKPTDEPIAEPVSQQNSAIFMVDIANSSITWTGSKPLGDKHTGSINISDGSFSVAEGKIISGNVTIDMNSIEDKDLEGKWKAKIESHLKSPDFFDVAKYPTATINIKRNGQAYEGALQLHGITKTISLPATISKKGNNFEVNLQKFSIDRTEWGVKYNSGKFFKNLKDRLISDQIEISGHILLIPKK